MAHSRRSVQEDKEDHGSPCDDIEAIEYNAEAERCLEELPECLAADGHSLRPRVLFGEAIAIGICTRFVRTFRGVRCDGCVHSR